MEDSNVHKLITELYYSNLNDIANMSVPVIFRGSDLLASVLANEPDVLHTDDRVRERICETYRI